MYGLIKPLPIKTISYETMDLETYLEEIMDSRQAEIDYLESINNETEQYEEVQTP